MRRILNIVRRCELGHAPRLADAAGARDVRLQVGQRPVGDEPHRLVERVVAFACRERRVAAAVKLVIAVLVLGPQRLLEPEIARCRMSARPTSTASSSV